MSEPATILLLPGHMCDRRMWDALTPAFDGWKSECHIPTESTIRDMARTCLNQYSGQLIPIGFSMGAIVALAMADLAPDRIAGLCLMSTNAGADRPDRSTVRRRQQEAAMTGALAKVVAEELKPAYFADRNRSDRSLRSLALGMAMDLGSGVFVSQSEALRTRGDYRHVLERVGAPVLIACGEEDRLCPPELHRMLAATSRSSELHVVEGAGHMLPLERPQALTEPLSQWLSQIEKEVVCPAGS